MVIAIQNKKEIEMNKNVALRWLFILAMLSIPWIYLAVNWSSLPERIPMHFGFDGKPDQFGDKQRAVYIPLSITLAALLVYLLLTNIYKLDPKRYARNQQGVFTKIAMAVLVFLTCVGLFVLNWTISQHAGGLNIFLVMMGLLFAYLGNVMHSIKPNYFAGFRLPWTLESENNWRATHLLVGKMWFAGGILIAILAIFIDPFIMFFIMFSILLVMIVVPAVYSYRFFKKEKAGQVS